MVRRAAKSLGSYSEEVVDLIVGDPEGYDDRFAALALFETTEVDVDEIDVRHHRAGECDCA